MKALTKLELDRLLDNVTSPRLRAMVLLAARHGLRASETVGLLRADVDLRNKTIVCRRLKNSITNTQPLGEVECVAILAWYRIAPASLYVFPGRANQHLNRSIFNREFKVACEFAQIPKDKQHPHTLKHFFCRELVLAGVNLAVIKQAAGHRSVGSTSRYTEMDDETVAPIILKAFGG